MTPFLPKTALTVAHDAAPVVVLVGANASMGKQVVVAKLSRQVGSGGQFECALAWHRQKAPTWRREVGLNVLEHQSVVQSCCR
jgi:hypothetical protein